MARRLVVNGDDFGFTEGVNRGIIAAHRNGILTATTLMANGPAFEHAVALARENPGLDVGCHLVLVQGPSVSRPGEALPPKLPALVAAVASGRLAVYAELRAQIDKILGAGIRPLHLDTHKHTHLLPPVLDAIGRLSREYKIGWVRRPFDFPIESGRLPVTKRLVSKALGSVRGWFHRTLDGYGCRTTDHFAGFLLTGRFRTSDLVRLIHQLPEGTTEFMSHPGICDAELESAPTRLKQSRQAELDALVATETRTALSESGVELIGYRDLHEQPRHRTG